VVEVQVGVDDDVDAGEIEVLLAQWPQAGIEVGHRRGQLCQAGVDQHARIGMVAGGLSGRQRKAGVSGQATSYSASFASTIRLRIASPGQAEAEARMPARRPPQTR
jgi:hypothetical protein